MERHVARDEKSTGSKIQAGEQVRKIRSACPPFVQGDDARSTGSKRCEDKTTSRATLSTQLEEIEASVSTSRGVYHAAVES